jgi:valyl-tRNA synthetase
LETKYVISDEKPKKSPKGMEWVQETDTFDTWFSSGQWPVAALAASDFKYFYPTQVMETGYDILFFWVARMLMLGLYLTGEVPFKTVYLHGLVRDEKGQKMSKSKGNVIDPLEMVGKYGADALRMALVMGTTPGKDKAVGEGSIRGMRNLGNKIWNAARFIKMAEKSARGKKDKEFLKNIDQIAMATTSHLENFKIGFGAEHLYNEFWHWFCDECIEKSKEGKISNEALEKGLKVFLKLLHPFVPFVTEAVWQEMEFPGLLMMKKWPTCAEASAGKPKKIKLMKILVWFMLGIGLGAGIKLAGNLQIRQEIEAQVEERQKIVEEIQALEILDQEKPDWRDLKLKTALLYWQLGEEEEAIKWLKEAKLLDPNGEKVVEVENAILDRT